MATLGWLCGQGAWWETLSDGTEGKSLEELEHELAAARQECRRWEEILEKNRKENKAVVMPPEQTQSEAQPSETGAYEALSKAREDQISSGSTKPVEVQEVPGEEQIPRNNAEIVGSELSVVDLSATEVEVEQQTTPPGIRMSPVDGQADSEAVTDEIDQEGEVCESMEDVWPEQHEHDDTGGLPGAGVQSGESSAADEESELQVRCSDEFAQAEISGVAAAFEGPVSQLSTGFDCDAANASTGKDGAERPPDERKLRSGYRDCISRPTQSKQTPAQLPIHRNSRHDPSGSVNGMKLKGLASSADGLSEVRAPCSKTPSAKRIACRAKTRDRRALTASESPEVDRQRREQKGAPVRTAGNVPRDIGIFNTVAQVFDPGGRR